MSEHFVGPSDQHADQAPGGRHAADDQAPGGRTAPGRHAAGSFHAPHSGASFGLGPAPLPPGRLHVRMGIPFNGVVPIWHDGTQIAWHRPMDGTDLADVLGLGHVETEQGPAEVPAGWSERVETGTLIPAGDPADELAATLDPRIDGPVLRLRPAAPSGRRAVNDPGQGVAIPLSAAFSFQEAMGATPDDFDIAGFCVHIGRLMLRAARDGAILVITLRAPLDPEPHHVLSCPSSMDDDGIMHFHLGTLLDVQAPSWQHARHAEGMSLLDVSVPYASLLSGAGSRSDQGLDAERLIAMAQPAVDAILQPGFPFALGCSFVMPDKK